MDISFSIESDEFNEDEQEIVRKNLGLSTEELEHSLSKIAKTAFIEYKNMFLERGVPSKADEVLQERLHYLILNYFINRLPNESEIQTIFQLTSSKSKTLLKNVISKYRTSIDDQIKSSINNVLQNAKRSKDKYQLVIQSSNILEELNEVISKKGPAMQKLIAVRGSASLYQCPESTFNLIRENF